MSDEKKKALSDLEIEQLQERTKKLAMEKSYYQLVMQLITKVSEMPGLENVIDNMLINTMNILGGSNLQLYYKIDEQLYYADVMGEKKKLDDFSDEVVERVFNTGWEEEIEGAFEETRLTTPEFTKAYTWLYPLKVGADVIAVFRMENLHFDMRQLYEQLPAFFNFAAFVLKNEILGQSRLQKMNLQLETEVATRRQTEKELRIAKDHLETAVEERTAELREKSEELDLFFTSTLDLLCIADTDGYFRKLNPEWEKALGYPLDELVGRKFLDLIHPDDLESALQAIATLSDQNPLLSFTNRYLHKDGSYRWLEWRSYPVGKKIYAAARDITERMKMEAELAERSAKLKETNMQLSHELEDRKAFIEKLALSEKEYHSLIHELQVAVVVHNPDTTIRIYNELACQLLGLSPGQMDGKSAFDPDWHFFDEQGVPLVAEQLPVNRAIATKQPVYDLVLGINRPATNDQVWALANANPVVNSRGETLEVVVTFIDITERRQIENIERARLHVFQYAQNNPVEKLLEEALNEAETVSGSSIGFFHFIEEDQETLWLQQWSTRTKTEFCKAEAQGEHYPVGDAGVWADGLRKREAIIHNDYASLPNKKGMPEGHAEVLREMVVPVFRGDKAVAILGVGNKQSNYTDADVKAMTFLAELVWDIVEKKRAEEEVQEMNIRFKAMTDSSPLAIYMSSGGVEQRAEYVNPTFTELFGYTIEDVPSVGEWWPLAYPDEAYRKQVAEDWEKRIQTAIENSVDIEPMETRVACKDGSTKRIVWGFFSSGQVDCSFGFDVTASREAEEEIRRFNTELEQIVEERTQKLTEINKRLEGFNEIMAEREMRVVEIKQEVNLLSQQLGREMPYKEIWNALQEK